MDPLEARSALADAARRRQQTIDAGSTAWPPRAWWGLCSGVLALGVVIDLDMVWLVGVVVLLGAGAAWGSGVRLRRTPASGRWRAALGGALVAAFAAHVLVQLPVRALGWPAPNTVGALAACLVLLLVARPVQARLAASLRP